ncbi:MAG: NAD(P)H-hydrate dehydratase [Dehalococcoidia bacterium]|nr:NAD(P)H-hydrate dehydratase [Dehalococcoidia bacterium]
MTVNVVTVAEMQALEAASEAAGVSTDTLMENAGLACARLVRKRIGGAAGRRVLLLIGPGNNGADGLVIARHLRRWGSEVYCYIARGRPSADPKMTSAQAFGVTVEDAAEDVALQKLGRLLDRCDVVVDAILGAGRYRPLEGPVADIAALVNQVKLVRPAMPVIAVDLPTGVNPDNGAADANTVRADETLALCFPKYGIANFPGAEYAGRVILVDIGLPPSLAANAGLSTEWMTSASARTLLPPRPLISHKGTFGHLLLVAGSRHFVGAAYLAAQGAHRVGAGLVTLATPESVYRIAASKLTETIHLPLPEDADGRIDVSATDVILDRIGGYSALAVGCGLGWSAGTTAFAEGLLLTRHSPPASRYSPPSSRHSRESGNPAPPTVIDADGLNNLSRCAHWADRLCAPVVLTPHPGEMATLTGQPTGQVQADRIDNATHWSARWRQTVLLKGAHSVVASPDGRRSVLPFANPALAAGGTGDVLTGIIGGLLAQGVAPYDAARLGGFLHGTAAERARHRHGDAGVVASDLLDLIPPIMASLRESEV